LVVRNRFWPSGGIRAIIRRRKVSARAAKIAKSFLQMNLNPFRGMTAFGKCDLDFVAKKI